MDQQRLFVLAHEAISVGAHYIRGEGWRVHVIGRRGGETWADSPEQVYSHLSSSELVDTIERELASLLGL